MFLLFRLLPFFVILAEWFSGIALELITLMVITRFCLAIGEVVCRYDMIELFFSFRLSSQINEDIESFIHSVDLDEHNLFAEVTELGDWNLCPERLTNPKDL